MDKKTQASQNDSAAKDNRQNEAVPTEETPLPTLYDAALQRPNSLKPPAILQLQRTLGNQAVQRLLNAAPQTAPSGMVARLGARDTLQRNPEQEKQKRLQQERLTRILDEELENLIEICSHLLTKATNMINNLARETTGEPVMGPLKTFDRVKEKALAKIQEENFGILDVGEDIKDILRATIVYEDFDALSSGYSQVYQELIRTYKVPSFVKMNEMFGIGKQAQGASGGYRDAKMVFNLDIPEHLAQKKKGTMLRLPKVIPMELQFNTKAALVVKQGGKLFPQLKGFDEMYYVIDAPSADELPRFDAKQFVIDLIERADKAGKNNLITAQDMQLSLNLPEKGLPKAHDLYEPKKKEKMDALDIQNAETYYPQIYDLAFRADNWTEDKGEVMADSVAATKNKAQKSGRMD